MFSLSQLSPGQQKLAMFGIPAVGVLAVIAKLRTPAPTKTPAPAPTGSIPTISTDAIGADQLSAYENQISGVLTHLGTVQAHILDQIGHLQHPPPPAVTPPITNVPGTFHPLPYPYPRPTPIAEAPAPPPPAPAQTSYTIVSGDTLWAIASRFYGDGGQWGRIYDANAATLDAAAQAHGRASSDTGHWIYPGTTVVIP